MMTTDLNKNIPVAAAVIQFAPKVDALQENLSTAIQLTFEALSRGARVVVLPELCLSGRDLMSPREAAVFAQEQNGYQTEKFVDLARKYSSFIAFGYVELAEGTLFNSVVLVGPFGPVANYRKKTLDGSDFLWATRGDNIAPIAHTQYGRIGLLIGDDVSNRIKLRAGTRYVERQLYSHGSVDILCACTSVKGDKNDLPDESWVKLVEDVDCNVVVSNLYAHGGGSCVIDRNMHVWLSDDSFENYSVVGGILVK